jgi:hypothetical protein
MAEDLETYALVPRQLIDIHPFLTMRRHTHLSPPTST